MNWQFGSAQSRVGARRRVARSIGRQLGLLMVALVTVTFGTAVSSAAASSLSWSQPFLISHQPPWSSPYGPLNGGPDFMKMSCPSSGLCVAIDNRGNVVTSTNPTGGTSAWTAVTIDNNELNDVSCASSSLCVAVDLGGNVLTSTNPTGGASAWTSAHVDTAYGGNIVAVSCVPASSLCVAVDDIGGSFISTNPTGGVGAWTRSGGEYFSSISCPSTSLCVATAGTGSGGGDILTLSNPGAANPVWTATSGVSSRGFIGNISCPSTSLCVVPAAHDSGYGGDLMMSTNPTGGASAWTRTELLSGINDGFRATTCLSTSLCLALDSNGAVWSSTNPTGGASAWSSTANNVTGIAQGGASLACGSTSMCIAQLSGTAASATAPTGGTNSWTPEIIDGIQSVTGVSCPSSSFCAAVDNFGNVVTSTSPAGGSSAWTATNITDFHNTELALDGISCPSSSLCVAAWSNGQSVYTYTSTNPTGGASAWSAKTQVGTGNGLDDISCPTTSFCAILSGGYLDTSTNPTGGASSWTSTVIAATHISCPTSSLCVGSNANGITYSTNPTGGASAWSSFTLGTSLSAVSCASATLCVALDSAGYIWTSTNPTGGAAAWTSSIDPAGGPFRLVRCASSGLCALDGNHDVAISSNPAGGTNTWSVSSNVDGADNGIGSIATTNDITCAPSLCVGVDSRGDAFVGTPPAPPVNSSPPTISGITGQGQTLTESHGTWSSNPTSYSYQWQDCNSSGSSCTAISGATSQTYTLTSGDVGHTIRAQESATNTGGTGGPASSAATAVVTAPPAPVNTSPPTISGTAQQGQTLTEAQGTWTNNPTSYSYQWERCDSSGNSCAAISGATTQTYTLAASDVGHTIRVQESTTNAGGTGGPATSAATAVVTLPPAPVNSSPPTISGTAQQGQTLTEAHGSWTNNPTSYSYQWEDCNSSGSSCAAIGGAISQTYTPTAADVGHTIRVQETASNASGSSSPASSAATGVVLPSPPSTNGPPPTISGNAAQGQTLTEAHGSWTGSPTSYTYQWTDCDNTGNNCSAIAGATSQTYTVVPGDAGHMIRVLEWATNAGGTGGPETSTATAVVLPLPPATVSAPSIAGNTTAGQTLTESHGSWSNNPTSYSYQWQDCDSSGGNCTAISGATSQTHTLTASDVGHTIRVQETASNAGGSSSPASSPATGVVQPSSATPNPPVNPLQPATSGTAPIGPFAPAPPSPAQITTALNSALGVSGKAASIAQVLKHGGYVGSFTAPSAGQLMISWYLAPKGAHAKKTTKPALIAAASVAFQQASQANIKIALTAKGRRLLKRTKQLTLTAKGAFTPVGQGTISTTTRFTLKK